MWGDLALKSFGEGKDVWKVLPKGVEQEGKVTLR